MQILKSKKGQAIVEMALIMPILLLVLCGIFEFGRIYNADLMITNASREAARTAVLGASDLDVKNGINAAVSTLDPAYIKVTITPSEAERVQGAAATVRIDYKVKLVTPFISSLLTNPFPISADTVMRVE